MMIFFFAYISFSHVPAEEVSRKFVRTLSKPLIGNDGRIYICSEKDLFAFESNGSIAWTIHLNYTCKADMVPVYGGREKVHHFFLNFFAFNPSSHALASYSYVPCNGGLTFCITFK